jgi:hypothetical protein
VGNPAEEIACLPDVASFKHIGTEKSMGYTPHPSRPDTKNASCSPVPL